MTRSARSTPGARTTCDRQGHLKEIYEMRSGRDLISRVTDAVMDDARAWRQRPLDPLRFWSGAAA
jgi:transposase-like protein